MRTGSYATREREQTIAELSRVGVPLDTIRAALRDARTLARLAEAQCNGDYPAREGVGPWVNGYPASYKSEPCGGAESVGCGTYWAPAALTGKHKLCPDCRAEARVRARLSGFGELRFSGDPRGFVVRLVVLVDGREREIGIA